MATQFHPTRAPQIDVGAWFADWSDHGGVAFVAGGKLYLGRTPCVDRVGHQHLDGLRDHILTSGGCGALATLLNARAMMGNA
jgi:hypothetical protein